MSLSFIPEERRNRRFSPRKALAAAGRGGRGEPRPRTPGPAAPRRFLGQRGFKNAERPGQSSTGCCLICRVPGGRATLSLSGRRDDFSYIIDVFPSFLPPKTGRRSIPTTEESSPVTLLIAVFFCVFSDTRHLQQLLCRVIFMSCSFQAP